MNIWASPKTTSAGLGLIITGAVHLGFSIYHKQLTESDMTATLISICGGVGLISAGDAGKSQGLQDTNDKVADITTRLEQLEKGKQ